MLEGTQENIDEIIKTTPIVLDINDKSVNRVANYYLPYSTGFEIECVQSESFDVQNFLKIPNILDVNVDSSEQRFRIPNGILGLNCLYNISIELKKNSILNSNSGNHYHVDFTDEYHKLSSLHVDSVSEYILNELDSWKYKGTYNKRKCEFSGARNWTRFKESTRTMEFRIGEMTFDYGLLFKRIVHCNKLAKHLKFNLEHGVASLYEDENITQILKNRIVKI